MPPMRDRDHQHVGARELDVGIGDADQGELRERRGPARRDGLRPERERAVDHRDTP